MARRSLRPELNRIRAWVRQGRTDAWIAHQLEVTVQQIQAFKREQGLVTGEEPNGAPGLDDEIDLRAEDDALIAAELDAAEAERREGERVRRRRVRRRGRQAQAPARPARRSRGGRRKASTPLEATFDHGDEGYGLWLDPAVQDDPTYAEYWAGHRPVEVVIEEDQIVIRRAGADESDDNSDDDNGDARRRLGPPRLTVVGEDPPAARHSRSPGGRSARTPRRRPSSGPTPPGCRAPPGRRCQSTSRCPARRTGRRAPAP